MKQMIPKQADRVWGRITKQFRIIFIKSYEGRPKRQFLNQFADKIQDVVPGVSREDIIIIATGLFAELRSIKDLGIRDSVIKDGGDSD